MKIVKKLHWSTELFLYFFLWLATMAAWAFIVSKIKFLSFFENRPIYDIVLYLSIGIALVLYITRQIKYEKLYSMDTSCESPRVKVPGLELIYERETDVVIVKEDGRPELRFPRPDLHYAFNTHESTSNVLFPLVETGTVSTPNGLKPIVIYKGMESVASTNISGHSIELRFTPSEYSKFMIEERRLSTPKSGDWKARVYTNTGVLEKAAIEKMNMYICKFFKDTADFTEEWLLKVAQELFAAKPL